MKAYFAAAVCIVASFNKQANSGWFPGHLQGGLDPNKISDLGADFGIIVRSLLELNKSGALKPSLIMS